MTQLRIKISLILIVDQIKSDDSEETNSRIILKDNYTDEIIKPIEMQTIIGNNKRNRKNSLSKIRKHSRKKSMRIINVENSRYFS